MIDRGHALSITRQAEALGISRGSVYYLPRPVSDADLKLMRRIDELHLEYPFAGARMLRDLLRTEGYKAGRKHIGTLMAKMGIEALYRRPNTSRAHPAHLVYPYLLRGLSIERANQVWTLDITYIPMARGFVYLVAVMDWYSRKVLAWRLSITMDVESSASRRCKTRSSATACRRSSTRIRAARVISSGRRNISISEVLDGTTKRLDYSANGASADAFARPPGC